MVNNVNNAVINLFNSIFILLVCIFFVVESEDAYSRYIDHTGGIATNDPEGFYQHDDTYHNNIGATETYYSLLVEGNFGGDKYQNYHLQHACDVSPRILFHERNNKLIEHTKAYVSWSVINDGNFIIDNNLDYHYSPTFTNTVLGRFEVAANAVLKNLKNSGKVRILGCLTVDSEFINNATGHIEVGVWSHDIYKTTFYTGHDHTLPKYAKFGGPATNHGDITIHRELMIEKDFKNFGSVIAESLEGNGTFINAENATAEFNQLDSTDAKIQNKGELILHDTNKIGSYTGDASSELVLTLPCTNPTPTALLTAKNTVTLNAGANIVLAATSLLTYLNSATPITIIQANTLTFKPSVQLYGKSYDPKNYQEALGDKIKSSSILIAATNVLVDGDSITAKVQMNTIATLTSSAAKFAASVSLGGSKNQSSATGDLTKDAKNKATTKQQAKQKQNISRKVKIEEETTKQIIKIEKDTASSAEKITRLEHKLVANHSTLVLNNAIKNPTIQTRTAFNTTLGINSGEIEPSRIWGSFAYYSTQGNNKSVANSDYKQHESILTIGLDSQLEAIDLNCSAAYLNSKTTTQNATDTTAKSLIGSVNMAKSIYDFTFSSAFVYGKTDHQNANNKYSSTEYSGAITTSYLVTFRELNLSVGMVAIFTAVQNPENNEKTKKYSGFGPFITTSLSYKLASNADINTELRAGYLFLKAKSHNIQSTYAYSHIPTPDLKIQPIKYFNAKVDITVNNLFYRTLIDFNHDKNSNVFGITLAVGYHF